MHRVCFVSPLARPIVEPRFSCHFGGAEVRAVNFARGLACDADFDVSIVLRSYSNEASRQIDSLTAHFLPEDAPIPRTKDLNRDRNFWWKYLQLKLQKVRRSIHKRRPGQQISIQQLIRTIPADVFCSFGVNQFSADVVAAAKATQRQSLLFIAHDQDLDFDRYQDIARAYGGNAETYRQVVESADCIVTQTPHQQELLNANFGRDGYVIRNPIDLQTRVAQDTESGEYILWVGRADTFFKRADKMLQLAAMCPEIPFVAIMNKRDERVFDKLVADATENVRIVSHVPYHEIESYYANATALLSTSVGEGFPNAFLQAGKYGQPILSLNVDPGEMISQHQCGRITHGDMDEMANTLQDIWLGRDSTVRTELSENIQHYVQAFHSVDERVEELKSVVRSMATTSEQKAA